MGTQTGGIVGFFDTTYSRGRECSHGSFSGARRGAGSSVHFRACPGTARHPWHVQSPPNVAPTGSISRGRISSTKAFARKTVLRKREDFRLLRNAHTRVPTHRAYIRASDLTQRGYSSRISGIDAAIAFKSTHFHAQTKISSRKFTVRRIEIPCTLRKILQVVRKNWHYRTLRCDDATVMTLAMSFWVAPGRQAT